MEALSAVGEGGGLEGSSVGDVSIAIVSSSGRTKSEPSPRLARYQYSPHGA
jgi:hypothetical protein